MNEKLVDQNVSPVIENSKLAEELTVQKALEAEVKKYKGFQLRDDIRDGILERASYGEDIGGIVSELVKIDQEFLIKKIIRKVFNIDISDYSGVSDFRHIIKETLDDYPDFPKVDYSEFYKYRCLYIENLRDLRIIKPYADKIGVGLTKLDGIFESLEERIGSSDYKDMLHYKEELTKLNYSNVSRYKLLNTISLIATHTNIRDIKPLNREVLTTLCLWKAESLFDKFKDKYDFYCRLVANSGTYSGNNVSVNIKYSLAKTFDIDESFKGWITNHQDIVIQNIASKVKNYFELCDDYSYNSSVAERAREFCGVDIPVNHLLIMYNDYLEGAKEIDYLVSRYNIKKTELIKDVLNYIDNEISNENISGKNSCIYYVIENMAIVYEDIEELLALLEGTFSMRFGNPLHNLFLEVALEFKRKLYGEKYFNPNCEPNGEEWNYLFSDSFYRVTEEYWDLIRDLERIKSPVIFEMLPHLLYGTPVEKVLDAEITKEQYLCATSGFEHGVNSKFVSAKRMKAITKNVLDILGLSRIRPEAILDLREEVIYDCYLDDKARVEEALEKANINIEYATFKVILDGISNLLERDNEMDTPKYLEKIYARVDKIEVLEVNSHTEVLCSYRARKPFIKLVSLIMEKIDKRINKERNSVELGRIKYTNMVHFPTEEEGCMLLISNQGIAPIRIIECEVGKMFIVGISDFYRVIDEEYSEVYFNSIEFTEDVSKNRREEISDKITMHNFDVMKGKRLC
ncbi:hypothetical protein UT300012_24460 [Paraclostridium bifermentans]